MNASLRITSNQYRTSLAPNAPNVAVRWWLRHGAAVPRIINSLNEPQDAKNLVDTQMRSRHGRG